MLPNWQNWCRLCAKYQESDCDLFYKLETISNLLQTVEKYFMISLSTYDGTPTNICDCCYQFLNKLDKFAGRCAKANKMFSDIIFQKINLETDLQNARYRYGLEDDEVKFSEVSSELNSNLKSFKPFSNSSTTADQSTDTRDLIMEEIYIIKEETLENKLTSISTKKKRGRPKRSDKIQAKHQLQIKVEQNEDSYSEDFDYFNSTQNHVNEVEEEDNGDFQEGLDGLVNIKGDSDDDKPLLSRRVKRRNGIFKCKFCDKIYNRRQLYEQHIQTKHMTNQLPFVCTKCPKRFSSEKKVKLHEAVHLPESMKLVHPCPYCDKKFSKSVNVQAHIRAIHIGDRPFICEECGKAFGTKGGLKEHQITHSEERPFQCSYCPKKFKNLPRLKTHEDIHNDTIYVCPHCGLQLNTKRTLKMHMVVHSDHKKYKCHYCGNEYKRSKALKNHLILHTGLRPYVCPFCDKTFANGSNCRSHKKKAHPLELAAMEASGEQPRAAVIPKLEHLQPKSQQIQHIHPQQNPQLTSVPQSPNNDSISFVTNQQLSNIPPNGTERHIQQNQNQNPTIPTTMQVPTVQLPITLQMPHVIPLIPTSDL